MQTFVGLLQQRLCGWALQCLTCRDLFAEVPAEVHLCESFLCQGLAAAVLQCAQASVLHYWLQPCNCREARAWLGSVWLLLPCRLRNLGPFPSLGHSMTICYLVTCIAPSQPAGGRLQRLKRVDGALSFLVFASTVYRLWRVGGALASF